MNVCGVLCYERSVVYSTCICYQNFIRKQLNFGDNLFIVYDICNNPKVLLVERMYAHVEPSGSGKCYIDKPNLVI